MQVLTECNLAEIVFELLNGKTLVFPTETSYGLGCDATNQPAVDKIFKIKGRSSDKPLLVVVPAIEMAKKYLIWNELLEKIATRYWPGPLTVVGEYSLPPLFKEGSASRPGEVTDVRMVGFNRSLKNRQKLRQNKTTAEKILWQEFKGKQFGGWKFRQQHGIGPYVADFYQPDSKVIIEIDGDVHFITDEKITKDQDRQQWFEQMGYTVIRFNNVDVFNNLEGVLTDIYNCIATRVTSPRPILKVTSPRPILKVTSPRPILKVTSPRPSLKRGGDELAVGVVSKENTLAIRVTAHPLLKSITEKLGRPLVATSANISDSGDIYDAKEIITQFSGREIQPDIILDYGTLTRQPPTTIVSVAGKNFKVLRQGEIKAAV